MNKLCVILFFETVIPSAFSTFAYTKEVERDLILLPKTCFPDCITYLEEKLFTKREPVPTVQELFLNGFSEVQGLFFDMDGKFHRSIRMDFYR